MVFGDGTLIEMMFMQALSTKRFDSLTPIPNTYKVLESSNHRTINPKQLRLTPLSINKFTRSITI